MPPRLKIKGLLQENVLVNITCSVLVQLVLAQLVYVKGQRPTVITMNSFLNAA